MMKNNIKTALLLTSMASIMMLIGYLIGKTIGATIAFLSALVINGILYYFSDKIVLKMHNAQPLNKTSYPDIFNTAQELATKMNIPMPQLWLVSGSMPNAFATGRNPAHGSIAFTSAILELLEPHELRGVIAHELAHIEQRDILITTIAAIMATTIQYLAIIAHNMVERKNIPTQILGIILARIMVPILVNLVQMSISRSREYRADEVGAHTCNDPLALASALKKLHHHAHDATADALRYRTASALCIVKPLSGEEISELFSTHPPLKKRVSALQAIHNSTQRWQL